MELQTVDADSECPECFEVVCLKAVMQHEIVQCGGCGVDLEVIELDPVALELAPEEEEDWGE
jgi:alpha-aminoadipate carrier protein LysW